MEGIGQWSHRLTILPDRLFPRFFHLPKLTSAGLVISLLAVLVLRVVDLLLAISRRHVVRIERQNLLIFLEGEVITAGGVISIRLGEKFLNLFHLGNELGPHRPVVEAGGLQLHQHLGGRPAIRVVAVAQNLLHNRLGLGVFAFRHSLLRQFHSAFAKSVDRVIMGLPGDDRVWEIADCHAKFLVRHSEILCLHGELAAGEGFLPRRQRGLAARNLFF